MHTYTGRALLAVAIVALAALSGCSDSDDNTARPSSGIPNSPPTVPDPVVIEGLGNVQVHYPPPVASTSSNEIVVRGITQDPTEVAAIYINDALVMSDDLANWSAAVTLEEGVNRLVVSEENLEGERSEVNTLLVDRSPQITTPLAVVQDQGRLLVLEAVSQKIISVDIETGDRRQFSPSEGMETALIKNAQGMVLDAANNRLLVYQSQVNEVPPEESEEDETETVQEPAEETPTDEVTDVDDFDENLLKIKVNPFIAVDLTTGEQSVFTFTPPDGTFLLNAPSAMTIADGVAYVADVEAIFLDSEGNRVIPTEEDGAEQGQAVNVASSRIINAMDLGSGQMQVFTRRGTPDAETPIGSVRSMASTDQSDFVYLLDSVPVSRTTREYRIIQIDKTNGKRRLFKVDGSVEGEKEPIVLANPQALILDDMKQRLLLVNNGGNRVLSITEATGKITVLSATNVPANSEYPLFKIDDLTLDEQNGILYATDDVYDSLLAINGETGGRTWIAGAEGVDPKDSKMFHTPACLALAPQQQTLIVCENRLATALAYDIVSGQKSISASAGGSISSGEGPIIGYPLSATHRSGTTFLLLDNFNQRPGIERPLRSSPRLLSLNNDNGALELLYSFDSTSSVLRDVAYDATHDVAYVADGRTFADRRRRFLGSGRITELTFTGNGVTSRTLSDYATPNGDHAFRNLASITIDYQNNRLLALDKLLNAVIAIDRTTGQRSPLSMMSGLDGRAPHFGPNLKMPQALVVDQRNNRALVLDSALDAIVAVDLENGQREIVYQNTGAGNERMVNGKDLELHPFGYVLVIDDVKDTLMAIDLETQQLVTLAR